MYRKYYQCFSYKQKDFLKSKNIDYLIKCRHYETGKRMWVFIFDNDSVLSNALTEWSNTNP
ncbi:hypothetical protein [Clostridium botulinum]|uniref:hypothetical protein n=1 Tax=Clostridium botulinum TaxID=1491 RepID=UPI001E5F99EB|nr:hypothetical protein [Clostridium botulinum]MCD3335769.1 hypothetical protein [Clostridium botulinum D/C]